MAATFTTAAYPAIEARIASDLGLLREAIFDAIDQTHLRTLALGGGFGRGEGTAFMTNNCPHIINDYDITVVHNLPRFLFQARYASRLDKVAERFARRLAIKQIDFGGQHYRELSRIPKPTIANYELFHGYHIFYGEDLLAPVAIHIPVEHIPLWEGTWLLRNRSIGLILAGLYFLGERSPAEEERENLWIETNKAVLAVGDAFLLAQGCYHWSYRERGRRLSSFPLVEIESWREEYCNAIKAKVNPGGCPYDVPMDELIQGWYRARDIMEQGFRWFETHRTGKPLDSWSAYLENYKEAPAWRRPRFWINLLRVHAASPITRARMARLRTEHLRSAGLATRLLFAVSKDGVDSEAVDHVAGVLGLRISGTPIDRWRKLAARLLFSIHPTGEAGRVARLVD
jgi:hypothetical protein